MATVNQEFQSAPMGRRLVLSMIASLVAILVVLALEIGFVLPIIRRQAGPAWRPAGTGGAIHMIQGNWTPASQIWVIAAPLVALLVFAIKFFYERSRISHFRIEENCLVLGRARHPLTGLVDVSRDPGIVRWAIRIGGNGGLGSIRGRYWSRRVGKFYAFMTDAEKAVVLRWPDKIVAVSPLDPEFFILSARSAAGLR